MTPTCLDTPVAPKYLSDIGVSSTDAVAPAPDDALLSKVTSGRQATSAETVSGWLGVIPWSHSEDQTSLELIPTDRLPDWIRNSLTALLSLCDLEKDWDGRGSDPPSRNLVRDLVYLLLLTEVDALEKPEVVPTLGGGIQLEWYPGDCELELEFRADGVVEFLQSDIVGNRDEEGFVVSVDHLRGLLARLQNAR